MERVKTHMTIQVVMERVNTHTTVAVLMRQKAETCRKSGFGSVAVMSVLVFRRLDSATSFGRVSTLESFAVASSVGI